MKKLLFLLILFPTLVWGQGGQPVAPSVSPTFTGTVIVPQPFTIGAVSMTSTATELNVLDGIPGTLTATELGYVDGATSNIQTQLDDDVELAPLFVAKGDSSITPKAGGYPTSTMYYNGMAGKQNIMADSSRVHRVISSNTQLTNTGNTNENTVYTGTIPAYSIGKDGAFEITGLISCTNSADDKTIKVKFGATIVYQFILTTSASFQFITTLRNRHSLTAQVSFYNASLSPYGISAGPLSTFTVDTGASITVTVTIQNEASGDSGRLEAFEILAK